MPLRNLILRIAGRPWVENFVRNSRLTQGVVRRFVAGESLKEALRVAEALVGKGFNVSLDLLGEKTSSSEEADAAAKEYESVLEAIAASPAAGGWMPERINISIKLTQLGLDLDEAACERRLRKIAEAAAQRRNFVRVDMEDSSCTERTLACIGRVHRDYPNLGAVLQSMLFRTERDVEELIRERIRVRLVKGAYLEGPHVAFQKKDQVDCAYAAYAERLLLDGIFPAFGTHDKRLIRKMVDFAASRAIGRGRFEFQCLFGFRRKLQEELLREGFIVRIYVPYGRSWYSYFMRRLAERPANLLFFLRSLFAR